MGLKNVCSDIWNPDLKMIAKKASQAVHVMRRFHIVAYFSKGLDKLRSADTKAFKKKRHQPILSKTRRPLPKRLKNLTEKLETRLAALLAYNLKSIPAYLLKKEFQLF